MMRASHHGEAPRYRGAGVNSSLWTAFPGVVDAVRTSFGSQVFRLRGDQGHGKHVGKHIPDGRTQPLKIRYIPVERVAPVAHGAFSPHVLSAMRCNPTIASTLLSHLLGLASLPIEPIGRCFIFERHALEFTPRFGT
jgi:hypothetical protein